MSYPGTIQPLSINRLYFGKYEAKIEITASYAITDTSEFSHGKTFDYKWKSLNTCYRSILDQKNIFYYFDPDEKTAYSTFIDCVKDSSTNFINLHRLTANYNRKHSSMTHAWRVSPMYVRRDQYKFNVRPKLLIYCNSAEQAQDYLHKVFRSRLIDHSVLQFKVYAMTDEVRTLIDRDKHVTVMAKLPFDKFEYRVWLNYSRLRNYSDHNKNQLLTMLTNYENSGLIRMQKSLREWLTGKREHLWNNSYLYMDCEATKDLMSLILVNTMSKCEHIKVKNG